MFLGIDLGTASVKALLLDEAGQVIHQASERYQVIAPQLNWAETSPMDWWQATCQAVKTCTENYKDDVKAISFSGQMHGLVLCDDAVQPLRPAILWADTRSKEQLKHYHKLSQVQKQSLANPIVTGMMGTSLLWLKEYEKDIYNKARWALQPKDWLRYQFTGEVFTDPSDASATLLYDLKEDAWAFDILESLGIKKDLLAPIVGSSSVAGYLSKSAAQLLNLPAGIPVATGGADAACSIFGTSLTHSGQAQINIGTAMQIFAIADELTIDKSFKTHVYRTVQDNYYVMAAMQNAGIAFEWLRKTLGLSWQELYQEGFSAPVGSEGLIFLPYLTGERTPHMNPDACGTWHGLNLRHDRKHLIRSVFEGIAFTLKDGLLALENTGVGIDSLRLAGGGTSEAQWQQLLADVLGEELLEIDASLASVKGAALLAAEAVNMPIKKVPVSQNKLKIYPVKQDALLEAFDRYQQIYKLLYL